MIQYPLVFKVQSHSTAGIASNWTTHAAAELGQIPAAIPPEFGGPGGGFSPEDFYALALLNCFIATFKVIAEKSKLHFQSIQGEATLTVDRNEAGSPWMKAVHLSVALAGVEDRERAQRLLEKASQSCLVLNSVRTDKTFSFSVLP